LKLRRSLIMRYDGFGEAESPRLFLRATEYELAQRCPAQR
jgi:hypothetical protein